MEPLSGTDRIANALEELVVLVRQDMEPNVLDVAQTMPARILRVSEVLGRWSAIPAEDTIPRANLIEELIDAVLG